MTDPMLPPSAVRGAAPTMEITRDSPQLGAMAGRVGTLHEIALQIDAARSREEILDVLAHQIRWLIGYDVAFVCLLNRAHTHYSFTVLLPGGGKADEPETEFPLNDDFPGAVIQTGAPMCLEDLSALSIVPGASVFLQNAASKSVLAVPIRTADEVLGCLVFGANASSAYHKPEIAIAQLLATQVGVALQNTLLFEMAKKRIAQIELVNEVAARLTSTLDMNELLHSAAETIRKSFNYSDVTVFYVDQAAAELRLAARSGERGEVVTGNHRQKLSDGIVGWVASHGEFVLANNIEEDRRYLAFDSVHTKSELAIPIIIGHEVVGVLNVEDSRLRAFDETDVIVLETMCDQLGSAIRNAKLYDELKQSNAKLTELDRMKSDFLSIVSHDFRSPLSSIVFAGQSLLRRNGEFQSGQLQEYLQVIVEQATRLSSLAEDTLSIASLESGRASYVFKPVTLERVIKDAASQVHFSRKHAFQTEFDGDLAGVRGDLVKLRQVLQNLIGNAVKYSPEGGAVKVAVKGRPEEVVISVSDEGIGIPENQKNRLFQKFSRIETEESKDIRGSGLGLWICKQVIRAHGGEIWLDGRQGKGTTFSFNLPKNLSEPVLP